jgi:hypothetical protein
MPTRSYFARVSVIASLVLFAACGGDPQVPTAAEPTARTDIAAPVASIVGQIPTVRITDQKGKGIKNVLVRWRVTAGGGRVMNDSSRTSASGEASSGGWTLGTIAGTQTLTATAEGVPVVTFTATAAPGPVAVLTRASRETQEAEVNTFVSDPPAVRAEDVYGNAVPNVAVSFSVTLGTGSVTGEQQVTDANGIARVGSWRLGTQAGQQIVRATALGAQPAAFLATGLAGPATAIVKIAGDNQQAVSGIPVTIAPGVRVVDAFANPVGNVPVTFTPGPNSGTVTGATTVSDPANGSAFVGNWTLGSASTQTLTATSSLLPNVSAQFTATVVQSLFDVDVRFVGDGGTTAVRSAFTAAINKWRSIIVGDVHNTRVQRPGGTCAPWIPAIDETINDVVIYARITNIDGPGQILGQAGPCLINSATRLAAVGLMEFDEADMELLQSRGNLNDVILHEMGHVFGIGTLWNNGRSLLEGAGTEDPFFSGTAARAQFAALNTVTYSGTPVPVHNAGGPGSRDSHWRESILGRELMTPNLNSGVANPLSRLTVGSLQDMGYVVNLAGADPFSFTASLYAFPLIGSQQQLLELGNDVANISLYEVRPNGSTVLVRPARR